MLLQKVIDSAVAEVVSAYDHDSLLTSKVIVFHEDEAIERFPLGTAGKGLADVGESFSSAHEIAERAGGSAHACIHYVKDQDKQLALIHASAGDEHGILGLRLENGEVKHINQLELSHMAVIKFPDKGDV